MLPRRIDGFTLVELLIVISIIAIISAIALPNYRDYVKRGHRSEAKAILMENAQFLERNFTANNCYHRTDNNCANATVTIALPKTQSPVSGTARYNIAFDAGQPTANSYVITAAPTGAMTGDECGTLTLNQLGQQGVDGASLTVAKCWGR